MIRIDAIYQETFWPWIQQNHPSTRMLWCEPFGDNRSPNLLNKSLDGELDTYVFFHDQRPLDFDVDDELFAAVKYRNRDLIPKRRRTEPGIIVVSEKGSEVDKICGAHGWQSSYYFFNGWAALDWYRGYDRSYGLLDPEHRQPTQIFMCSESRLLIGKDNTLSSCDARNLNEIHDSLVYVTRETVFSGNRLHLTKKTFQPIALGVPLILLATAGSLEYLKSYGFRSFGHIWSEDYDLETDDLVRVESVARLVKDIDAQSISEKKQLWSHCLPIIKHNQNWFYGGGFEQMLWRELTDMLKLW